MFDEPVRQQEGAFYTNEAYILHERLQQQGIGTKQGFYDQLTRLCRVSTDKLLTPDSDLDSNIKQQIQSCILQLEEKLLSQDYAHYYNVD